VTLLDGDRPTSDPAVEEAEALIEEARHRQRRRWQWIAGMLAILVAVGAVVAFSVKGRDHPGRTSSPSNSVVPALSRSSVRGLPAEIVAAVYLTSPKIPITSRPEAGTEIDVVSTRTGRVLRVLAHGWVAVIAHVGRKVFFLQIQQFGPTVSTLCEVAVTGGPVRTLAIGSQPTPSPNGRYLAYVTNDASTDTSRLELLDFATGATTSIALLPSVHAGVAGLAWMSPGNRLAVFADPNAIDEIATQLMIVDVGSHQHLKVARINGLPARMTWTSLFRSSTPNTLFGGWIPAQDHTTPAPQIARIEVSSRGVTLRNVGILPPSCTPYGVDAMDLSGRDVLCPAGPLDIVRLVQGRYRVAGSVSANNHLITSATW
jgi:hypothetical protein